MRRRWLPGSLIRSYSHLRRKDSLTLATRHDKISSIVVWTALIILALRKYKREWSYREQVSWWVSKSISKESLALRQLNKELQPPKWPRLAYTCIETRYNTVNDNLIKVKFILSKNQTQSPWGNLTSQANKIRTKMLKIERFLYQQKIKMIDFYFLHRKIMFENVIPRGFKIGEY